MIKEVIIEGSLETLKEKLLSYKNSSLQTPQGFTKEEYQTLRQELRNQIFQMLGLQLSRRALIITGHQPNFQHPGIIFKDLLAWKLAKVTDSIILHLIVDTDRFEVNYHYPIKYKDKYATTRNIFIGGRDYGIFKNTKMIEIDRERFYSIIGESYKNIDEFVGEEYLEKCKEYTNKILSACLQTSPLQYVLTEIKQDFYQNNGIQIYNLPVSKLVDSKAFQVFAQKICENQNVFNTIYNSHLVQYRHSHKIKNKAQPLPNLAENEFPFWVYDKNKARRFPMKEYPSKLPILPRAITLTMFVRLFLSDLFIHGTGGGRYEVISENVLKDFFKIPASPYSVASATMHLDRKNDFDDDFISNKNIKMKLREYRHSPDTFLTKDHPLYKKKREIVEKLKTQSVDKREIHKEIMRINSEIQSEIPFIKNQLEFKQRNLPLLLQTHKTFQTRTFPFYFYDIKELINYINEL